VALGKYQVTAGRMRRFLTAVNGNVRGFVQSLRTAGTMPFMPGSTTNLLIPAVWDPYLSTSMEGDNDETPDCDSEGYNYSTGACYNNAAHPLYAPMYTSANNHVGPTIFKKNPQTTVQGCNYGGPGVHMYYLGSPDYFGETPEYTQDIYDQKPMQCVDWLTAQAFCLWDGGRLETMGEWAAAWGAAAMPWTATANVVPKSQGFSTYTACRFPTASDAELRGANAAGCAATLIPTTSQSIEYADYEGSYEWPTLKNDGNDYSAFIAPPGRHRGRSTAGHADIVGNLLEMTSNVTYNASPFSANAQWTANGSWEVHNYNARANYGSYSVMDKYGKQGVRCAYPK
jgi:hypothetical protein